MKRVPRKGRPMTGFRALYNLLWGDLVQISLPGGSRLGLSLLVLVLVPAGVYFTLCTRFLPFRLFPEMLRVTLHSNRKPGRQGISGIQALIVSTACRVGMGNLVGVVAAISAGGAGAVFWMWIMALLGASTAFVESTLAQLYKQPDPLYGGWRGGPARPTTCTICLSGKAAGASTRWWPASLHCRA